MKQSWQTLNNILDSVTALQDNQYHSVESLEIKESADSLKKSLQPCIQELLESSNRLKDLIDKSLKELQQAEALWMSKEKIANVNMAKVWQEITILTGLSNQIKNIADEQKQSAFKEIEKTCQAIFHRLERKHFRDKQGIKVKIGWSDKDAFNKAVKPKISYYYSSEFDKIATQSIKSLFDKLNILNFKFLFSCYSLFDQTSKLEYIIQTKKTIKKLNDKIENPNQIDNIFLIKFSAYFNDTFENWRGFGDIYHKEVYAFEKRVIKVSKSMIVNIIDDRIKLIKNVIEEIIYFYNNLLEKQNRYSVETREQRLAEKSWIEQQQLTLLSIKENINEMNKK